MAIIGTDIFWRASKNRSYRTLIQTVFKTLVSFLQANGLLTREVLSEGTEIDGTFVLRRSDFTEEGFEFYRRVEQRWFGAIDRGVAPTDTRILAKTLTDLRRASGGA